MHRREEGTEEQRAQRSKLLRVENHLRILLATRFCFFGGFYLRILGRAEHVENFSILIVTEMPALLRVAPAEPADVAVADHAIFVKFHDWAILVPFALHCLTPYQ